MAISNFANAVMADGPIGYWRLGDAVGSTGATDTSGKGNDGNVIGDPPAITFGQPGSHFGEGIIRPVGDTAALFNGKTGRIIVLNSISLNSDYLTIEAIVSWNGPIPGLTQNQQPQQRILEKSSYPSVAQYSLQIWSDGHIQAEFRKSGDSDGTPLKSSVYQVRQHVWTHVVATYDGNIHIYADGLLKDETSWPSPVRLDQKTPTPANLLESGVGIGNETQRDRPFNGLIDEVALYPIALTADKILHHYQSNFVTIIHPPVPKPH